jgi:hypothetical protein
MAIKYEVLTPEMKFSQNVVSNENSRSKDVNWFQCIFVGIGIASTAAIVSFIVWQNIQNKSFFNH